MPGSRDQGGWFLLPLGLYLVGILLVGLMRLLALILILLWWLLKLLGPFVWVSLNRLLLYLKTAPMRFRISRRM